MLIIIYIFFFSSFGGSLKTEFEDQGDDSGGSTAAHNAQSVSRVVMSAKWKKLHCTE